MKQTMDIRSRSAQTKPTAKTAQFDAKQKQKTKWKSLYRWWFKEEVEKRKSDDWKRSDGPEILSQINRSNLTDFFFECTFVWYFSIGQLPLEQDPFNLTMCRRMWPMRLEPTVLYWYTSILSTRQGMKNGMEALAYRDVVVQYMLTHSYTRAWYIRI